jgi:hypothetical protein
MFNKNNSKLIVKNLLFFGFDELTAVSSMNAGLS